MKNRLSRVAFSITIAAATLTCTEFPPSVAAADFDFSFTFRDGSTLTGCLTGDENPDDPNLIENVRNVSWVYTALDGTEVHSNAPVISEESPFDHNGNKHGKGAYAKVTRDGGIPLNMYTSFQNNDTNMIFVTNLHNRAHIIMIAPWSNRRLPPLINEIFPTQAEFMSRWSLTEKEDTGIPPDSLDRVEQLEADVAELKQQILILLEHTHGIPAGADETTPPIIPDADP